MHGKGHMSFTTAQIANIREGIRARESRQPSDLVRGLERVEVTRIDGLHYEAVEVHGSGSVMIVDEPAERGGTDDGSTPIGHFLCGVGACLLNQVVRCAVADELPAAFTSARVRGEFSRAVGGGFSRISVELHGDGELAPEEAETLLHRAEALCYIHQTLARAVELTTALVLGGARLATATSRPDAPGLRPSG